VSSETNERSAVIILSGGLDSSGVAAYWRREGYHLNLLTFNYGQRSLQEIKRAQEIGRDLKARDHKVIDISFMKELYGSTNVLTDSSKEMPSSFQSNIIVPIRNAVFLTIATAYAFSMKAKIVAYGAHLSDQPYPDCRPDFAKELADALNLGDIDAIRNGLHPEIRIWSPAIQGLSKEAMLKISYKILGNEIYRTWSCYEDGQVHCGKCESCNNRKKAFKLADIEDKTEYSS
jgi:7-cyano-7-deazaguanine synthase